MCLCLTFSVGEEEEEEKKKTILTSPGVYNCIYCIKTRIQTAWVTGHNQIFHFQVEKMGLTEQDLNYWT